MFKQNGYLQSEQYFDGILNQTQEFKLNDQNKAQSSLGLLNTPCSGNNSQTTTSRITDLREARNRKLKNDGLPERESSLTKLQSSYETLDMLKRSWEASKEDLPNHFLSLNQRLVKKQEFLERSCSFLKKNQVEQIIEIESQPSTPSKNQIISNLESPIDYKKFSLTITPSSHIPNQPKLLVTHHFQRRKQINSQGLEKLSINKMSCSTIIPQGVKKKLQNLTYSENDNNIIGDLSTTTQKIISLSPRPDDTKHKNIIDSSKKLTESSSASRLSQNQEHTKNSNLCKNLIKAFSNKKNKNVNNKSETMKNSSLFTNILNDQPLTNRVLEKPNKSKSQNTKDNTLLIPTSASNGHADFKNMEFLTPTKLRNTSSKNINQNLKKPNSAVDIRKNKSSLNLTQMLQNNSSMTNIKNQNQLNADSPKVVTCDSAKKANPLSEINEKKDEVLTSSVIKKSSPTKMLHIIHESVSNNEIETDNQILPKVELKAYLQEKRAIMKKIKQAMQGKHENLNTQLKKLATTLITTKDLDFNDVASKEKSNPYIESNKWLKDKENFIMSNDLKSMSTCTTPQKLSTQKILKANLNTQSVFTNKSLNKHEKSFSLQVSTDIKQLNPVMSNFKLELSDTPKLLQVDNSILGVKGPLKPKKINHSFKKGSNSNSITQVDDLQIQNKVSNLKVTVPMARSISTISMELMDNSPNQKKDPTKQSHSKLEKILEFDGYMAEGIPKNDTIQDTRTISSPLKSSTMQNYKKNMGLKTGKEMISLRKKLTTSLIPDNDNLNTVNNIKTSNVMSNSIVNNVDSMNNSRMKALNLIDRQCHQ